MKDNVNMLCGQCGNKMDKVITGCNHILKGGGWTGRDLIEKKERKTKSSNMGVKTQEKLHYNEKIGD